MAQDSFVARKTALSTALAVALVSLLAQRESIAFQAPANAEDTAKQNQVAALVTQAQQKLQQSQWDLAIADCNQALAILPASASALLARGMAFNGKGEYDSAIQDFDAVVALPGRDTAAVQIRADAYTNRSFSLYEKGQYLQAVDSAYFAVLEKGDHAVAHNHRARAYLARAEFDKAIVSADRAIYFDPKFAEAYSSRGAAYGEKGNYDQSLADQNKALELAPQLAVAYQRRGAAYGAKRDFNKALADFQQALSIKPDLVEALCDRAYLYGLKGDLPSAMADLDSAIQLKPSFLKAHMLRGLALLEQKEFDQALASFNQVLALKADHAGALCFRGYAYVGKDEIDPALADFNQAISLDPKLAKAYRGRSKVYRLRKMTSEANADIAKAKELESAATPATTTKNKPEPPPRFLPVSQGVASVRRAEVLRAAQEIDRLVSANYEKHKVQPNPLTTDWQFVRRIYLDITGTIPTYKQTRAFLNSKEKDKRSLLIEELLASDGYASHFFNYWADVLRYTDDLNGNVRGESYRQWIKQSLAENKPWDKLVHELLSAEGLVWDNPATGYLQRDANMPLDNMNNTVRIFLGTRIGCAQCHNHPFDRWTQKEFYQMAAFTFGTATSTGGADTRYWSADPSGRLQEGFAAIEQEEEDRRRNYYGFNRMIGFNMTIVNDRADVVLRLPKDYAYSDAKPEEPVAPKALFGEPALVSPGEAPRKAFARWLVAKENPRFALTIANRLWRQAFGVGQIEPVDDMMDSTVAENPELMKFLEAEIKRLDFDMKEFLRTIYSTQTYQRQACFAEVLPGEPYHFPGPLLRRMTAEQAWDSFLTLAVVDPNEYRELPANLRTTAIEVDLNTVSAPEVLAAEREAQQLDAGQWSRQQKYVYQGVLLARASELPSPVPPNHFLRMFGQSDRELISTSSTSGSVPQVLFMFNGPITHMLLEKGTTLYNTVTKKETPTGRVKAVFLTILSREPDEEELEVAKQEVQQNGPAGYGNVIWSLVNTREFLFIQ